MPRATVLGALAIAAALPAWAQKVPTALELFVQRDKGYCIACHQLPAGTGPASTSDVGPKLEGAICRPHGEFRFPFETRRLTKLPLRSKTST